MGEASYSKWLCIAYPLAAALGCCPTPNYLQTYLRQEPIGPKKSCLLQAGLFKLVILLVQLMGEANVGSYITTPHLF